MKRALASAETLTTAGAGGGFARVFRWLAWGLAALLCVLAVLVVLAWLNRPRDPVHAGRRLSGWLEDLVGLDAAARGAASNAIVHLGTNALPLLMLRLGTPDPAFGRATTDAQKYLPRPLRVWTMRLAQPRAGIERRWQAAAALGVLGAEAAPAIPALARAVRDADSRVSGAAIEALRGIRPEGLVVLAEAMRTTNQTLFANLGSAISRCGPDAARVATQLVQVLVESPAVWHPHLRPALAAAGVPAVSPLAARLGGEDAKERDLVVAALQALTREDYASVMAVVALGQDPNPLVRRGAVQALSGRTFWERRALAGLVAALGDSEPDVRLEAIAAIVSMAEWTDYATNAVEALRGRAASAAGPERDAAAAAIVRLETLSR